MNRDEELDKRALNTCAEESADVVPNGENEMPQGRKHLPTPEERRDARARIAQWFFTPEPFREPSTLKQLAKDLHISYSYARYLKDKIPNNIHDYIAQCEAVAVARYGEVCETLADKAKAGDKDAAKLIAQEMVKPLKSPAAAQKNIPPPELP